MRKRAVSRRVDKNDILEDIKGGVDMKNNITDKEKIHEAIDIAIRYGQIEGDHHRIWVIDQMVRALAGSEYDSVIAGANEGEDGPNTYSWDIGIAP